jgi:hypothetical protein
MKVKRVSYHRNGVSGQPFYTVEFTVGAEVGRGLRTDMLGIVSNWSPEPEEQHLFTEPFYAVIDPAKPNYGYRGDTYWPELRDAIYNASRLNQMHYGTSAWYTQPVTEHK